MAQTPRSPDHSDRPAAPSASSGGSAPPVEQIDTAECWTLMQRESFGRLVVNRVDGAPDVFPVNYLVHEGSLYLRSAPGGKLRAILTHPAVAFEIDGAADGGRWSVVVHGTARRVESDAEIKASGVRRLVSSSPTPKHAVIRVVPTEITGRRFAESAPPAPDDRSALFDGDDDTPSGTTRGAGKPRRIPHFRPLPEQE